MTEVSRELPRYKCHKEVWALKIKTIVYSLDGSAMLTPVEPEYASFPVTPEYVTKHNPQVDGYWVQYDDGYTSFSPSKAFEDGYTRL